MLKAYLAAPVFGLAQVVVEHFLAVWLLRSSITRSSFSHR